MSDEPLYDGDDRRTLPSTLCMPMMTKVAGQAAHDAVEEMLEKLGIDVDNHLEMQEDMSWLRKWRKMSERVGSRVVMTVFTLLTAGIVTLVWTQIQGGK